VSQTQENSATAEKLLEVAGEIFARKGMSATVREICAAAGCSVAAINYHFGDKQRLYIRCVRLACEQKQALFPTPVVNALPAGTSPEAVAGRSALLREFLQAVLRRIAARSQYSWQDTLAWREMLHPTPEVEQEMANASHPDFDSLNRLLSAMLGAHDRLDWRQSLVNQILAQTMYFKIGSGMRRILGISTPHSEDPRLAAEDICRSVMRQIASMVGETTATAASASELTQNRLTSDEPAESETLSAE
jgi:TetR/AcrR family transcriptional regulator, regulator of cefoperazone and chloramphenicol sensitivity